MYNKLVNATKKKQTYRYREKTSDYREEEERGAIYRYNLSYIKQARSIY